VSTHRLRPGDEIVVGDEAFRFEDGAAVAERTVLLARPTPPPPVLRVTVSGGGPVGLTFALLLDDLMGERAAITVHDGRWTRTDDGRTVWRAKGRGASRRQQVVTVQSRQWSRLPAEIQDRLFGSDAHTEMWPTGPDSIDDLPPRNVRIAHVEDQLLALADERSDRITLVPEPFDPSTADALDQQHVLAVCEGSRSRTRDHFAHRFGVADTSMYSLDGRQVQDVVLGLRVRPVCPTRWPCCSQWCRTGSCSTRCAARASSTCASPRPRRPRRWGIDPVRQVFAECVQSQPCLMERKADGSFSCSTHDTFFLPALLKKSPFWGRVEEGLRLFGVAEEDLTAVTCFRLDMVQRPRFTAELLPRTPTTPGTFGFLLGRRGQRHPLLAGPRAQQRARLGVLAGPYPGGLVGQAAARRRLRPARGADGDAAVPAQEPGVASDGHHRRRGRHGGHQGPHRAGHHLGGAGRPTAGRRPRRAHGTAASHPGAVGGAPARTA
jgi:hypothetical protein